MIIHQYIPDKAIPAIEYLIKKNQINIKIVRNRKTKHGDFRAFNNGYTQITINENLNKHQFLLTLIHEIAHHITHIKFGHVQPHGKEWKTIFQHLMLPFLNPEIYPSTILPYLAKYLKNPKASTDSDAELSLALRNFKAKEGYVFVFEIELGKNFNFRNNTYQRGKKRRTRYECLNLANNKTYLFNKNAEVLRVT